MFCKIFDWKNRCTQKEKRIAQKLAKQEKTAKKSIKNLVSYSVSDFFNSLKVLI